MCQRHYIQACMSLSDKSSATKSFIAFIKLVLNSDISCRQVWMIDKLSVFHLLCYHFHTSYLTKELLQSERLENGREEKFRRKTNDGLLVGCKRLNIYFLSLFNFCENTTMCVVFGNKFLKNDLYRTFFYVSGQNKNYRMNMTKTPKQVSHLIQSHREEMRQHPQMFRLDCDCY